MFCYYCDVKYNSLNIKLYFTVIQNKDPEPPIPWEGIRDASKNAGDVCAQLEQLPAQTVGSEDCLYLNIHIPYNVYLTTENPVMIWIHGGAYLVGSGNDTHKRFDYLMAKDVILVSINYRLGAFGKNCTSKKTYFLKMIEKFLSRIFAEDIERRVRISTVY